MTLDQVFARLRRLGDVVRAFDPISDPPPQPLWAFMRWCLSGSSKLLAVAIVVSIFAGSFEIGSAILLGMVIDTALEAGPGQVFIGYWPFLLAVMAYLLILRPLTFGASSGLQSIAMGPGLNVQVLARLHRWTMGQAITFFDNDFAGRIAQKSMQTARAVTEVTIEAVNTVVFALAAFASATLLLISIDWRLSLILAIWLVGYYKFVTYFLPRIRKRASARAAARAAVTGQVVDTITNMRTVKLFAHSEYEDQAAINAMGGYRETALDFGVMATTFRTLLIALSSTIPVVLIGSVLYLWSLGVATPGDIAATGTVALRLSQMTGWVSHTLMGIYTNIGEVEDGMRTLSPRPPLLDSDSAVEVDPAAADIRFNRVTFAYGRDHGGVSDIDLHIRAGEKVGIVGASGAGKSTLVALLLRLYDTEKGAIMVGDHDVRAVTQESLRRQIGMVTQETAMFNRSARDNILYGRPDASEDQLTQAAKKAEAHDFIGSLKDFKGRTGYEAHLGERGVKLSGGQRQRIALARAILKDAPILILDEATSALDSEVEAQIQTALERVMEGKTVLAIAHRLSTIARMDRIIVMDEGRIVEEGDHATLLSCGGLYARYWQRQSGGFLGVVDAAE